MAKEEKSTFQIPSLLLSSFISNIYTPEKSYYWQNQPNSLKVKGYQEVNSNVKQLQSVSWILAEFYFNKGLQRLYTGTCIILQKTINGFLCLLIVFLKSKTYQLILKDVIKLNRNLR